MLSLWHFFIMCFGFYVVNQSLCFAWHIVLQLWKCEYWILEQWTQFSHHLNNTVKGHKVKHYLFCVAVNNTCKWPKLFSMLSLNAMQLRDSKKTNNKPMLTLEWQQPFCSWRSVLSANTCDRAYVLLFLKEHLIFFVNLY